MVTTVLAHDAIASIILRDPRGFDKESRVQVDSFFSSVLILIEGAIRVGQGLGLVGPCDVQVVAVVALGGLREALVRMLEAQSEPVVAATSSSPPGTNQPFKQPALVADELLDFFLRGVSGPAT